MEGATTERLRIASAGADLEARWDNPADARGVVVFCHPHPQHGGTMAAPLMHRVTKALVAARFAVLRFNFRGVGGSTGTWGDGNAEIGDVAAAHETAASRSAPVAVAGWSFGAATALAWQARSGTAAPLAAIAPPLASPLTPGLPAAEELPTSPRLFVVGDRDQFVTVADLQRYADAVHGHLEVLPGSDHFFHFREATVGKVLARFFAGVVT